MTAQLGDIHNSHRIGTRTMRKYTKPKKCPICNQKHTLKNEGVLLSCDNCQFKAENVKLQDFEGATNPPPEPHGAEF